MMIEQNESPPPVSPSLAPVHSSPPARRGASRTAKIIAAGSAIAVTLWIGVRVVQAVADAFFERVATSAQGRLVLLVDGRRSARPGPPSVQMLERDVFVKLAWERGAEVIDAERVYATHWEGSTLSLEVGPYDRHLNALGVGLLMKAVASRGPW